MENDFISVKRNPAIRERMHYISEAVKTACKNPDSHNVFNAGASPLYLVGNVYKNFEDTSELNGEFCLIKPDKFDGICRDFWKRYCYKFDVPVENVKIVDI
ncbi:hypothetical protein D4Q76_02575 [archaeon]|nr:MAG: hypothetical protein D4Q76_02575 [archaeon]